MATFSTPKPISRLNQGGTKIPQIQGASRKLLVGVHTAEFQFADIEINQDRVLLKYNEQVLRIKTDGLYQVYFKDEKLSLIKIEA